MTRFPHDDGLAERFDREAREAKLSKDAKAMRRYRQRQKDGTRVFRMYCSARFLSVLVEEGFLAKPTKPQDVTNHSVNEAIYRLLNAWRQQLR